MKIELPKKNINGSIILMVLQRFNVPFEIEIAGDLIRMSLQDDLPLMLVWDLGEATGKLMMEVDRIFGELNWPIGIKKYDV